MSLPTYNEHGLTEGTLPHPDREISVREMHDRVGAKGDADPSDADPSDADPGETDPGETDPSETDLIVIDCREDDELAIVRFGFARHIPLTRLITQPEDLEDDLPAGKGQPLAILCRTGHRSMTAALALSEMGFTDVRSVAGGLYAMSHAIDSSITRY